MQILIGSVSSLHCCGSRPFVPHCLAWCRLPPTPWIQPNPPVHDSCFDSVYCPALMNVSVGRDPAMCVQFHVSQPLSSTFGSIVAPRGRMRASVRTMHAMRLANRAIGSCAEINHCAPKCILHPVKICKLCGGDIDDWRSRHHAFDPKHPLVANYFGGAWYSTPGEAECRGSRTPGDKKAPHCSWQVHPSGPRPKSVNATCMLDRLLPLVEANGKPCFSRCAQPRDRRSNCYLACVTPAIIGLNTSGIAPIDPQAVITTWEKAFETDSPTQGGCPAV
jgi:hypothetical protein